MKSPTSFVVRPLLGLILLAAHASGCGDEESPTDTGVADTSDVADTTQGDVATDVPDDVPDDVAPDVPDVGQDVQADTDDAADDVAVEDTAETGDDAPDVPADDEPPTVAFTAPASGDTVAGATELTVDANDNIGVTSVEFFANGITLGQIDAAPFAIDWDPTGLPSGAYTLSAVASDAAGNDGTAEVAVTYEEPCSGAGDCPPTELAILSPLAGASVCSPVEFNVDFGSRTDIETVSLAIDGAVIDEFSAPFEGTWDAAGIEDGTYTVRVTAVTTAGLSAFTDVEITLANDGEVCSSPAPTVRFTAPAPNAFAVGVMSFVAEATDEIGVANVAFFIDSRDFGVDSAAPYSFDLSARALSEGTHTLRAVATNVRGRSAQTSQPLRVDRTPPNIEITAPVGATSATEIALSANADDLSGIDRVEWYLEDTTLTLDVDDDNVVTSISGTPFLVNAEAPYSGTLTVSDLPVGAYRVVAVAYDGVGQARAAFGDFRVDTPPTITLVSPAAGTLFEGPAPVTVFVNDDGRSVLVELLGGAEASSETVTSTTSVAQSVTLPWTPNFAFGPQTITVRATDSGGNVTTATLEITVDHPLQIGLETCIGEVCSPAAEGAVLRGPIRVVATPADDSSEITETRFFVTSSETAVVTSAPWEWLWQTAEYEEGVYRLRATARNAAGDSVEAFVNVQVENCAGGDSDSDGIADECDLCPFDPLNDGDGDGVCGDLDLCIGFDDRNDADVDGIPDGCDICPNDPDNDDDSDGRCADEDVCPDFDDSIDEDNDRLPDACDPCLGDAFNDADGDGVCSSVDRCFGFDDSIDADADGEPDLCDECPNDADNDIDGDGICGDVDICPLQDNAIDRDGDGIPDLCDACPIDRLNDADGDGNCANEDLCFDFDDRIDADADGIPDACDICPFDPNDDDDNDGVCGDVDVCPGFYDTVDTDGDGVANGCDVCPFDPLNDADSDGVCGNLDRCPGGDDRIDSDSDGLPDACDACPNDPDNDIDGDGACGDVDICPGFNDNIDTDLDGTPNACDECPYDPLDDEDDDGVCGDVDDCEGSDLDDMDNDDIPDSCDACPLDPLNDIDGDSVCGDVDVCPDGDDTINGDGDLFPDDCDICPRDAFNDEDDDGVCGNVDRCRGEDDRLDMDEDGQPDGCDICPNDPLDDEDLDGVCGDVDLCPDFPDYIDRDGDLIPDLCDSCPDDTENDDDEDGVCGSLDICPGFDDNVDSDSDGLPDGCDVCPDDAGNDSDGDGVCEADDICFGDDNIDTDADGVPDACDLCEGFDDEVDTNANGVPDGCE